MTWRRALTLSLVLHLILGLAFLLFVPNSQPVRLAAEPPKTRLEWLEVVAKKRPADEVEKKFVRQVEVPKELLSSEKQATPFASEHEQSVKEQMQARRSGLSANRTPGLPKLANEKAADMKPQQQAETNPKPKPTSQRSKTIVSRIEKLNMRPVPLWKSEPAKSKLVERGLAENFDDLRPGDVELRKLNRKSASANDSAKPFLMPNFSGMRIGGESTSGYALPPNIKFGDFTVLNTERYLYYSFFSRAEEMIRPHWITAVRAALFNIQQNQKIRGDEVWTSRIEFLLDEKGRFVKALISESSGQVGLDQAGAQSVRRAQQIPNPPQEMRKEDGFIHLNYSFTVNFVPQYAETDPSL